MLELPEKRPQLPYEHFATRTHKNLYGGPVAQERRVDVHRVTHEMANPVAVITDLALQRSFSAISSIEYE